MASAKTEALAGPMQPAAAVARGGAFDQALRALIGLMLAGMVWVIYDAFHENIVVVGDAAPEFSITADNGRTITPTSFGGKLLVLNFWATWCPTCIDEIPSLDRMQQTLAQKGVVVLGVSVDKDEQQYRDFLRRARVSFLTARDPSNKINLDYGTTRFPETYIIGSNGKVLRKIISSRDWMDPGMISDIESLL
jgi:peroxiredoxin